MQRGILVFLHILFFNLVTAQESILQEYIQQGLASNLTIKQKEFSLEKSILELREARGKFLPSIGLEARYSKAGGGRTIEFPVGDLMNPVYEAINLTRIQASQMPIPFPELENRIIPFLREEEHETKIRAIQPVFQPALYFNQKIKSELQDIQTLDLQVYKRELINDIKRSYYNYLKTVQVVILYKNTLSLLKENLRVSQRLFENGQATKEVIYRAQAELSKIEQELAEALRNNVLASAYFNHLLNRPLDQEIKLSEERSFRLLEGMILEEVRDASLRNREELKQLKEYINVASSSKAIAITTYFPGVVLVADYGFQGKEYRFKKEDDFWMVSGILQWNFFNGFQDDCKRQLAEVEKQKLQSTLEETEQLIRLQAQEAYYNLDVARQGWLTSEDRLKAARESYNLVSKKFEEGLTPHIEFIDARNTLTSAEVFNIISKYDYFIRSAELERVAALWKFDED